MRPLNFPTPFNHQRELVTRLPCRSVAPRPLRPRTELQQNGGTMAALDMRNRLPLQRFDERKCDWQGRLQT